MLYRIIEPLKEGEEVQFVGVYVLRWRKVLNGSIREPTVGFVEATKEEIQAELKEKEKK